MDPFSSSIQPLSVITHFLVSCNSLPTPRYKPFYPAVRYRYSRSTFVCLRRSILLPLESATSHHKNVSASESSRKCYRVVVIRRRLSQHNGPSDKIHPPKKTKHAEQKDENAMAQNGTQLAKKAIPEGQVLTGKQEHCRRISQTKEGLALTLLADLKRELIAQQTKFEITELNSPTALQRFGAPFKSDFGEVSPLDSDLPILRYIFVHHVRQFPFLDQANEKEFWQDKLQVVCGI